MPNSNFKNYSQCNGSLVNGKPYYPPTPPHMFGPSLSVQSPTVGEFTNNAEFQTINHNYGKGMTGNILFDAGTKAHLTKQIRMGNSPCGPPPNSKGSSSGGQVQEGLVNSWVKYFWSAIYG